MNRMYDLISIKYDPYDALSKYIKFDNEFTYNDFIYTRRIKVAKSLAHFIKNKLLELKLKYQ